MLILSILYLDPNDNRVVPLWRNHLYRAEAVRIGTINSAPNDLFCIRTNLQLMVNNERPAIKVERGYLAALH